MPLNAQGQLKCVDQEACLQLIFETGQRPERQITTFGLVPITRVEAGEQVTESFWVPEGFLLGWRSNPNRRNLVLVGCVWPWRGISLH